MEESLLSKKKLTFNQGSNYFRQRLALSLLSAKPIKISEIRSQSPFQVGVADYEVSFIQLLDKISNGSRFKISETGTEVNLIPGTLLGGSISHVCHESRPLSYYLEPLLLLAPFCKKPLRLTLKGKIQNDSGGYNSIYKLKHAALPIMEIFGLEPDIQVKSRSFEGSEIFFTCTVKKQLLTLRNQLNQDCGKVKKIRGLVYGFRISPQMLNRVITAAKGAFLPYINDVFITNDPVKNSKSKKPGYGVILYAETTKNITYAVDGFVGKEDLEKGNANETPLPLLQRTSLDQVGKKRMFDNDDDEDDEHEHGVGKKMKIAQEDSSKMHSKGGYATSPEELGTTIANQLLQEIYTEGRVDSVFQWLLLGLMALGPKDVTSSILGPLTPFTVQFLRDLKTFFGATFKVENYYDTLKRANLKANKKSENEEDEDDNYDEEEEEDLSKRKILYKLSCLGTGYINLNKTMV